MCLLQAYHLSVKLVILLTLKVSITTAADDIFSEKTSLDISCESSAWQTIHMKCQNLLSLKIKKNRMSSATNFVWRFKG